MKKINYLIVAICCIFVYSSCTKKQYKVVGVEGTRIEMDSTWDEGADPAMVELLNSFKEALEAEMNVEIGTAVQTLIKGHPEAPLANFTADVMKSFGEKQWGNIDFTLMNNGGIRSTLNEGPITVGSIFEIYPFENQLVLLEVPGKAVKELFDYLAINGGEALSEGIRFVIKDKKVKSLLINGQALDENKTYRIVTVDFLAEGNSGMGALKEALSYTDSETTLRDVMIAYVKAQTAKGKTIDAELDGRVVIE
ncbi:5'-nucleotidase C-terminal domain-containing protein [Bacteroidales bacterium OttesenSCG-928-A17]|nr:5'-nucleotidase C-terminal domain-containing protein [Bacteroidales bacterium OttesenSCG-928-A17]